jgi:CheY-like chemotaxis protein
VVDDDPDVRWIIAQDLQEIGYLVTEADSGRAALAILEQDAPCDLMVADLVMPGLSGLDTLRLARRTRPDLKVLFASGYPDLSRLGGKLGSCALRNKPFKPETWPKRFRPHFNGFLRTGRTTSYRCGAINCDRRRRD